MRLLFLLIALMVTLYLCVYTNSNQLYTSDTESKEPRDSCDAFYFAKEDVGSKWYVRLPLEDGTFRECVRYGKNATTLHREVSNLYNSIDKLNNFNTYHILGSLKKIVAKYEAVGVNANYEIIANVIKDAERAELGIDDITQECRDRDYVDTNLLTLTAAIGDVEAVRWLIEEKGFDPNWTDCQGLSVAHYAASNGHGRVIRYLVEEGGYNVALLNKRALIESTTYGATVLNMVAARTEYGARAFGYDYGMADSKNENVKFVLSHGGRWSKDIIHYDLCMAGETINTPAYTGIYKERFSCFKSLRMTDHSCSTYKQNCKQFKALAIRLSEYGYNVLDNWAQDRKKFDKFF